MNDFTNMLFDLAKALGEEFLYVLPYLAFGYFSKQ